MALNAVLFFGKITYTDMVQLRQLLGQKRSMTGFSATRGTRDDNIWNGSYAHFLLSGLCLLKDGENGVCIVLVLLFHLIDFS